ncbi:MAG: iron-sulfur cluster assembly accessory protein [Polyangiaceae bacterium]|nr:iron-sulfur cluster assembly accessory protein [Polyangiaceae bacterium]
MSEVQAQPEAKHEADAPSLSLSVSAPAVDAIARQMKKRGTLEASLRLGVRGGGCSGFSYVIEFHDGPPHARDRVFDHVASDGTPVRVVVDPKSLVYLRGTLLDWEQTLMKQGFKFVNPNEKAACGCGSSFSV